MKRTILILAAVGALALSGCGSDDSPASHDIIKGGTFDCSTPPSITTDTEKWNARQWEKWCKVEVKGLADAERLVKQQDKRQKALQTSLKKHFSSPVAGYSPNVMSLSVDMNGPGPDKDDSSLFGVRLFVDLDGDDGPAGTAVIKYQGVLVHSTGAYTYGMTEFNGQPSNGDGGVTNGFIKGEELDYRD